MKHASWCRCLLKPGGWSLRPRAVECYKVRTRGGPSAFSRDGFSWTDACGNVAPRPADLIVFHKGPLDGQGLKATFPKNLESANAR